MSDKLSPKAASQLLIETSRTFYNRGWMQGTSGNLSLRLTGPDAPLQYLITASGRDKGVLTPADVVRVGEGGVVLEPVGAKSSAETLLHDMVYQTFPQARAVYHVHTVAGTLLSRHACDATGCLVFSDLEMLKGLGFSTHDVTVRLPVMENSQDIAFLSRMVLDRLVPEVPGFMLKGHGLYTWGNSPFEAKRHVEIWEFLFQVRLMEWMREGNPVVAPIPLLQLL